MSFSHKQKQFQKVVELSRAMLNNAESGNWDVVFEIEVQRTELLKDVFIFPFTLQEKAESNQLIQQVISINKQIETVTTQIRDSIGQQVSLIHSGKKAVRLYAQNAG